MTSSPVEIGHAEARTVHTTSDSLVVELVDGRTLAVPLAWFPRLAHGTLPERDDWQLTGRGHGIHWPQLDEDIAVEDLLAGRRSGESQASLRRWLNARASGG